MQEALNAARQTSARVSPNPRVGAVLVKGDKIIARGWHNGPGTAHAEVMAIHAAGPAVAGSTPSMSPWSLATILVAPLRVRRPLSKPEFLKSM
ncbi:hypothetical protein ORD20_11450 [Sulfobacillus thermotolerans]